jgi:hypothetical protein
VCYDGEYGAKAECYKGLKRLLGKLDALDAAGDAVPEAAAT